VRPSLAVGIPGTEIAHPKVNGVEMQQQNATGVTTTDGDRREDSKEDESTPTRMTFPLTAIEQLAVGERMPKKKRSFFKFWHKNIRSEKTM